MQLTRTLPTRQFTFRPRADRRFAWSARLITGEETLHHPAHAKRACQGYCLVRLIVMFMFKHAADVAFKDSRRSLPKNPPLAV
jgi:hypothetical protein